MTDALSEERKLRLEYEEWDAPRCYVCTRKVAEDKMRDHITKHSLHEVINALTSWSVDSWKAEKK